MSKMNFFLSLISLLSLFTGIIMQENAQGKLSDALLECYNNTYGLSKENRLPSNMHSFIAIIRKIEENPMLNMDLRQLSVALLHRFRQDGIVKEPLVDPQPGVTPYALNGFQFYRHSEMLKLIPGNAKTFPNNSINHIERCSLHSMLSSTIDTFQRGDESSTCKIDNDLMRIEQSLAKQSASLSHGAVVDDVETLSSDQLISIKDKTQERVVVNDDDGFDADKWYPDLPSNALLHLEQTPTSQCPSEGGVIKTDWGIISGGPILAGIAAALQPQNVRISDLITRQAARGGKIRENVTLRDESLTLDNKWIATLAGDLLEVALRQGPRNNNNYNIGLEGHFNSSIIPKHYYLNVATANNDDNNQGLELTAAELRGDIDGLILANQVALLYTKVSGIKLSQILDMYYSDRGIFNSTLRACTRKHYLLDNNIGINETISTQTFRAALVLSGNPHLTFGTISQDNIEKYSIKATNKLFNYLSSSSSLNDNCQETKLYNRLSLDITIFIDTTWPFNLIKPILHILLEKLDVNAFASNFTLVNAKNGQVIINKTCSILDIYHFNETHYSELTRGFDLPKSIDILRINKTNKLNNERDWNIGGGQTDVVLIIPYSLSSLSDTGREYSLEKLTEMRYNVPDTRIIFLTGGTKDRWSSLVVDADNDVFSVGSGTIREISGPIDNLVNRIKRLQRRLLNSQCGADWKASSSSSSASYTDYVEPLGINFYRLHPNYFFKRDNDNLPMIKIQGQNTGGLLKICNSRKPLNVNTTGDGLCTTIETSNSHTITFGCSDVSHIDDCTPLFISIFANITQSTANLNNYQCTDSKVCRYPDMIKYTISYENLICTNSGTSIINLSSLFFSLLLFISI